MKSGFGAGYSTLPEMGSVAIYDVALGSFQIKVSVLNGLRLEPRVCR